MRSYDREGRLLSYVENRNIRPATYAYTLGELGEVTASDSYAYPGPKIPL